MIPALTLAAMTNIASEFFKDFAGTWTCGNAKYRSQWSITSPDGDYWTIVTYGLDKAHPGGTAYVGWLPQARRYVYNDYHNDGSFARLTAPAPIGSAWHWTGTYYAAGAAKADPGPDIWWRLQPDGSIVRTFGKNANGKVISMGSDRCTKTP